jgi:hypothetical protein
VAADKVSLIVATGGFCRGVTHRDDGDDFQPLLPRGFRELERLTAPPELNLLTSSAAADLSDHLSRRLSRVLGPVIAAAHEARQLSLSRNVSTADTVHVCLAGSAPFAAAAEMLVRDWAAAQARLLRRLARDRHRFPLVEDCVGSIRHLTCGCSDEHNGAETATVVTFVSNERLVYKPRRCAGERIWFRLLQWLNDEGFCPSFYLPRLWAQAHYSWMEYLPRQQIPAAGEAEYFRSWGAQALIAQLVGFADLHQENWVVAHGQPVLVDAEVFGRGAWKVTRRLETQQQLHPLLATGLLPLHNTEAGEARPFETAPLHARMHALQESARDNVIDGYVTAAEFLRATRGRMARFERLAGSLLSDARSRILVRATREYGRLLRDACQPRRLLDPVRQHAELLSYCHSSAPSSAVAAAEVRALQRFSIPRFYAPKAAQSAAMGAQLQARAISEAVRLFSERL